MLPSMCNDCGSDQGSAESQLFKICMNCFNKSYGHLFNKFVVPTNPIDLNHAILQSRRRGMTLQQIANRFNLRDRKNVYARIKRIKVNGGFKK